jgi:nitrogen fixation protein NifX
MLIAVVSTDGKEVNEHFGKAERFLIYELTGSGPQLVEERKAGPLSTDDMAHDFDSAKFDGIVRVLDDCRRVYAARIGGQPSSELIRAGLVPVIYTGPIVDISI